MYKETRIEPSTSLHPLAVGRFLYKNRVNETKKITKKGINKVGVEFDTATNAINPFKAHEYEVFQGIVRRVDLNTPMDKLINHTKSVRTIINAR